MATHSTILAWEIPLTEDPGGLQSMGSQKSDTTKQINNINKKSRHQTVITNKQSMPAFSVDKIYFNLDEEFLADAILVT